MWPVSWLRRISIRWKALADVAREKLVEAAHLSDDPIIQLGLAEIDLELERYQEAIKSMPS